MKRRQDRWILVCSMLLLVGCGNAVPHEDTIAVDKRGQITCTVVEDFDKDFYDAEELKEVIDEELASYNESFAQDHLTLKKFEVKDGIALLQTRFEKARYYADYTGLTFFVGTVAQAQAEGYDLSGECMDTTGSLTDLESIEGSGELQVLILEEAVEVKVPGKIVCASRAGDVVITGKKEAVVQDAREAFIVYR